MPSGGQAGKRLPLAGHAWSIADEAASGCWGWGEGYARDALPSVSSQARVHTGVQGVSYGGLPSSSSPLPNNGALPRLQVRTFSRVPSAMAFHSPALSALLPLPMAHSSLAP